MELSQRRRSLTAAYLILFLDNFGFAIVFPIFPILMLDPENGILAPHTLEATRHLLLGCLLAAFPIAQFLGAPFFGDLADRLGRKQIFFYTILGSAIGYALSAGAIFFSSFSFLIVSRLITGFFAGNLALAMAAVSDLTEDENARRKGMSYVAMLLGVSWVLAIIVGAYFSNPGHTFHPTLPFWITTVLSLLSIWILVAYFTETLSRQLEHRLSFLKGLHNILRVFEEKKLRALYVMLFFWVLGMMMALPWAAPIVIQKFQATQWQIMILLGTTGIAWSLGSGVVSPFFLGGISMRKVTLWSLILTSILYFFVGASDYFFYFTIFYAISSACTSIAWGTSMSLVSLSVEAKSEGKALGIAQSTIALAQFIGPLLGGLIAGASIEPIFYLSAIFVLAGFLCLLAHCLQRKS